MDSADDTTDAATEAFEGVRHELAQLRRVVERLAAGATVAHDYTETLAAIHQNGLATGRRVDTLLQSPVLALTPGYTASAGSNPAGDRGDRTTYGRTERRLKSSMEAPLLSMEGARAPAVPRWWLGIAVTAGLIVGLTAFGVITGPFAHAVPAEWLLPERFAADIMQMSMWDAGERLMAVSDPTRWKADVADEQLVAANKEAISACRKKNPGSWKQLHCTIVVQPS